jgi:Domain of unknown function (DUF4148)
MRVAPVPSETEFGTALKPTHLLEPFMKLSHLLSLAVVASTFINAHANAATPRDASGSKTRTEVRAEAVAAMTAGIPRGESSYLTEVVRGGSTRTRAEVHAEAVAAVKAGIPRGDAVDVPYAPVGPSTLTRAQVRAEAIEALRLGLVSHGDREARLPTASELEAIRMAGQRAVDERISRRRD